MWISEWIGRFWDKRCDIYYRLSSPCSIYSGCVDTMYEPS